MPLLICKLWSWWCRACAEGLSFRAVSSWWLSESLESAFCTLSMINCWELILWEPCLSMRSKQLRCVIKFWDRTAFDAGSPPLAPLESLIPVPSIISVKLLLLDWRLQDLENFLYLEPSIASLPLVVRPTLILGLEIVAICWACDSRPNTFEDSISLIFDCPVYSFLCWSTSVLVPCLIATSCRFSVPYESSNSDSFFLLGSPPSTCCLYSFWSSSLPANLSWYASKFPRSLSEALTSLGVPEFGACRFLFKKTCVAFGCSWMMVEDIYCWTMVGDLSWKWLVMESWLRAAGWWSGALSEEL